MSAPARAPQDRAPVQPRLGAVGTARFVWRQLTSMRTALLLLLLLAVGAVPGSVVPQEDVDPAAVVTFREEHPVLAPWLDRLSFFDVYASPWFSAVYLLLFVSLVGCVLPRSRQQWTAWRSRPPRTPSRLERLPEHRVVTAPTEPSPLVAAGGALRRRRYRVDVRPDAPGAATGSVAAERGHLRETGNLVFHLALVGLLLALAASSLLSYRAQVVVPVGQGFSNTVARYDTFDPGAWVAPDDLPPFAVGLDGLDVEFEEAPGSQLGAPRDFEAQVQVVSPGEETREDVIRVNEPLHAGGAEVYLAGNGYAPVITVTDAQGRVVYSEPTPFLAQDAAYTSTGVVKVLGSLPEQLGFTGAFLPTAVIDERGPRSIFPDARDPLLLLTGYRGDLGAVNDGLPVNVYELDTTSMDQLTTDEGAPWSVALRPGDAVDLPGGLGELRFGYPPGAAAPGGAATAAEGDPLPRFAGLTVRHDPGRVPALVFSVLAMLGLVASLFTARRRVFVRVGPGEGGAARVEVAGLTRGEDAGLAAEVDALARTLGSSAQDQARHPAASDRTTSQPAVPQPAAPQPTASQPAASEPAADAAPDADGSPAGSPTSTSTTTTRS
ncbi:cytochrome c biogenesis protein ResB [uncultured Pseudokineococcus sp.]|uniref:cytochrome c biogenesis protein ResB n=1 Tax=uncultured Pseudokineococcus sp. TaxID=1642928 RepID=UPI002638C2DB|nr:cytochrome c biogenesis protein ResB [uncultured Pseudokineococcus sp.]